MGRPENLAYLAVLDVELVADIFVGFPVVNLSMLAMLVTRLRWTNTMMFDVLRVARPYPKRAL